MGAVDNHAVQLRGQDGDGAPTLVFVHGYGCDKSMWDRVVPHFEATHRVVLYDLMGCGGSALECYDREKYATLDGHASDLIAILDELGVRGATLIGHSVSAMTVALAANQRTELARDIVMVCPSPSFLNEGAYEGGFEQADIDGLLETLDANYLGWSSEMAPAIMGTPNKPEHGERLTNSFCQADPKIARHFARVTFLADHREDVKRLAPRTLVLQCRDDVIVPPGVGDWMAANMPDASLVTLDATGHCPHISYPQETSDAISAFLAA